MSGRGRLIAKLWSFDAELDPETLVWSSEDPDVAEFLNWFTGMIAEDYSPSCGEMPAWAFATAVERLRLDVVKQTWRPAPAPAGRVY